jgi:hypothetical protein
MANYVDLFWRVRAELPGVPVPLLYLHYADSAREFFKETLAWQYSVPGQLDLAADTGWPTLVEGTNYPTGSYIVQPVKVKWDGSEVCFKTRDQLDEIDGNWETATGSSLDYWTITEPGTWRLQPLLADDTEEMLTLRLALAPKSTATAIPDALANEFQEPIAKGTLARLLKIPGKDWTDLSCSASYTESFEADKRVAKSRAAADFGRPRRAVQYGGLSIGGSGKRNTDDYGR